jgi:HEAT repeat protein
VAGIEGLASQGGARGAEIERLRAAWDDPDPEVRQAALHASVVLARTPDEAADAFVQAWQDESDSVRAAAVMMLEFSTGRPEDDLRFILQAVHDGSREVREAAGEMLGILAQESPKEAYETLRWQGSASLEGMGRLFAQRKQVLAPFLLEDLSSPDPAIRSWAARTLYAIDWPASLPEDRLRTLLDDPDPQARLYALECAETLGAEALPLLERALGDSSADVRGKAIELAFKRGPGGAPLQPALEKALGDPSGAVAASAATALLALVADHPAALSALSRVIRSGKHVERCGALRQVERLPYLPEGLAPVLEEAGGDPSSEVQVLAQHALEVLRTVEAARSIEGAPPDRGPAGAPPGGGAEGPGDGGSRGG